MGKNELIKSLEFILGYTYDIHDEICEALEQKPKKYLVNAESDLTYAIQVFDDIIERLIATNSRELSMQGESHEYSKSL